MEEIYPLAHIVCLPTYYMEGIPKALLEAAACGRPIVATDVPGCREVVQDGQNGFLVPPRNATELAGAIARLVTDETLRASMGRNGRELALSTFSVEQIIPAYFEIYGIPY
jgi:glycosyltransferase involved in cell wall biosynthesis